MNAYKLSGKDIAYVGVQFLLFGFYLWDVIWLRFDTSGLGASVSWFFLTIGIAITVMAVLQLNRNLSPFPRPKEGSVLITKGLFRFIRHPIYTGILVSAFAYAYSVGSGYKILIGILLWLVFYFKVRYEEKQLIRKFPEYIHYKKKTGRFLPKFF